MKRTVLKLFALNLLFVASIHCVALSVKEKTAMTTAANKATTKEEVNALIASIPDQKLNISYINTLKTIAASKPSGGSSTGTVPKTPERPAADEPKKDTTPAPADTGTKTTALSQEPAQGAYNDTKKALREVVAAAKDTGGDTLNTIKTDFDTILSGK